VLFRSNGLDADLNIVEALQSQDIVSQQLGATVELIETLRNAIKSFSLDEKKGEETLIHDIEKLQSELNIALHEAKEKKERFIGKFAKNGADNTEIEFF